MSQGLTVDTSVIVPAMSAWHPAHREALTVVSQRATAIVGHALLEAYSVLTRLPSPFRVEPALASAALGALDLPVVALEPDEITTLIQRLGPEQVSGGAAYDALVAATAQQHGLTLITSDTRARRTYQAMGVRFEPLGSE